MTDNSCADNPHTKQAIEWENPRDLTDLRRASREWIAWERAILRPTWHDGGEVPEGGAKPGGPIRIYQQSFARPPMPKPFSESFSKSAENRFLFKLFNEYLREYRHPPYDVLAEEMPEEKGQLRLRARKAQLDFYDWLAGEIADRKGIPFDDAWRVPLAEVIRAMKGAEDSADSERNPAPPVNGATQQSEGGKPTKKRKMTRAEAEILVREWLMKNAAADPSAVTRDGIAKAIGCSGFLVSNTAAWQAFDNKRKALKKPTGREVPLTDGLLAVVPAGGDDPARKAELNELIKEQEADERRDARTAKRRRRDRN